MVIIFSICYINLVYCTLFNQNNSVNKNIQEEQRNKEHKGGFWKFVAEHELEKPMSLALISMGRTDGPSGTQVFQNFFRSSSKLDF